MSAPTGSSTTGDDAGGGGLWHSPATLIIAAAIVGLAVVMGGYLTFFHHAHAGTDTTASAPGAGMPVPAQTAPPVGPLSNALTSAPASRWELYQGVVLPYTAEHGPKTVDGLGVAAGYTHDPTGALMAATQVTFRTGLAPDDHWREIVTSQITPSEGRDAYTAARQQRHIAANSVPYTTLNQIAGFRVVNYTDAVAVFDLVVRAKDGTLQTSQSTVVWAGGDWKLTLPPDGSLATAPTAVPSLSGFVPWSGV